MTVAIYVRVSSDKQEFASQLPDLERWVAVYANGDPVVWYTDKATGKKMDRPEWNTLEEAMRLGQVSRLVIWRLDRLGRTASGLTALFDELQARKVNLVSIKDGLDLETAAGRLMANVLASVAAYETEVRAERVNAGIAAAKAAGKKWGGSKKGRWITVTPKKRALIRRLIRHGHQKAEVARLLGMSRRTIYSVLAQTAGSGGESPATV